MLVSETIKYTGKKVNGYKPFAYFLDSETPAATIFIKQYWVENGIGTYVDTVDVTLTPEETLQRMTAVVNGKSLVEELYPWAVEKGKAYDKIPADAVLVE